MLTFTNKSTNAENYVWRYGGGQTDTNKDIVLTAKTGGTYTISLEAKGKGGTDSYSKTITVADPPVVLKTSAGFTYSPSQNLTAPVKITFINTSKNAASYKWDFGDGTSSADANPTKEFTKTGTFTVKLTATGSSNTDESSAAITINGPATVPTADFTFSPSTAQTAPVKITFTNASKNATSYKWDFGDGTSSADVSPIKEFTKAGDYTVKLTATDAKNQTAQKTAIVSVKAVAATPVADWTWSASNLKVTFTNASKNANSYSWNFNDGTAASTATNPVHDYAKAGTYTVTLTASDGKTQHQQSKLVTVSAPVAASCDWNKYTNDASLKVESKFADCDGVTMKITNKTNITLECHFCIELKAGGWSCGASAIKAGSYTTYWSCKNTGKVKVWAMSEDEFNKNHCSYPKP